MTTTLKSNLFVPEVLADALRTGFAGQIALHGTEAAILNTSMPGDKRGGDKITIPRFAALGAAQSVADGDPLVPVVLSMDSEQASVVQVGNAVELTKWSQIAAAFADPYSEASRQILATIVRAWDQALIDAAVNPTGLAAAQKVSVWSATTPKTVDLATLIQAKMAFGDEQDGIAAFVCHSKVLGDLYGMNDSQGRPMLMESARAGGLPTVLGVPCIVSDRMPKDVSTPSAPKYTSMFIKRGALALWANGQPSVNEYTDPLKNVDTVAWFSYFAAYRYPVIDGFSKCGVTTLASN